MSLHIFGVRHHGPGCARSLRTALETLKPDIVLVEGPPDAQSVLPLLVHTEMQPPVALLIYAPENPQLAVYYPFAQFSPEWQALHYALQQSIPARFIDLPQAIQLARHHTPAVQEAPSAIENASAAPPVEHEESQTPLLPDPLAMLAQAAGYDDHELWWERQVEQRADMRNLFEGILEAMTELRAHTPPPEGEEAQREAHMRQMIRAAQKEGFQRIAVVCGAWHAPVLSDLGNAKADAPLLSGLKRIKVEATWIPWTNSRLSYRSGYGAGIASPGWYEHLWATAQHSQVTSRWITRAAHLLRQQGLDASSASVIEAIRLAESLAALRDLPMAGMAELHEAIETVLCNGNTTPMQLIREQLEIGERQGEVPAEAPTVPLQRDLENRQRRLRLKPTIETTMLDLDLRNENDRARSQLFHQLNLLGIAWGKVQDVRGKSGTFHEFWQLQWQVTFVIRVIEMNIWGNTIEQAATAFARHDATTLQELPELTALLDKVILAELTGVVDDLIQAIQQRAAVSADVRHLMDALPPLAKVVRYGNVRQTKTEQLAPVLDGLFERIVVGLPGACSALDDDAAQAMIGSIAHVQESLNLLNREDMRTEWQAVLRQLMERETVHGLVQGRCCRLLLEQNALDEQEFQHMARLALSPVTPSAHAAAWIEGVLHGNGLLLLHLNGLWLALDSWLNELASDVFEATLPLLRRAFSEFQAPERRAMGEKVRHMHNTTAERQGSTGENGQIQRLHHERGALTLPLLAHILGTGETSNAD